MLVVRNNKSNSYISRSDFTATNPNLELAYKFDNFTDVMNALHDADVFVRSFRDSYSLIKISPVPVAYQEVNTIT